VKTEWLSIQNPKSSDWSMEIVSQPGFPLLSEQRKAHLCLNADMGPNWGKMLRKRGKMATFEKTGYMSGNDATHVEI